jgi:hypothetical protein
MATIPEEQLNTWSNIGAQAQSKTTYATIKAALERQAYNGRRPRIFLQGSYGNDTNIRTESDVDIVICYQDAWFRSLESLPVPESNAYNQVHSVPSYDYPQFGAHIYEALRRVFGPAVTRGTRAFNIAPNDSRRSADVIAAFEFRRYTRFRSVSDQLFDPGIGFLNSANELISNYPEKHSANLTAKNQATNERFKPTVRIFKNMRTKLVNDRVIASGVAPSYFVECLLHNAPNNLFVGSDAEVVRGLLVWGWTAAKSQLVAMCSWIPLLNW